MRRRVRMVDLAREECGGSLAGRRVAVGIAFRPESDDVRDSPALEVAAQMKLQAQPGGDRPARDRQRLQDTAAEAAAGAELVLALTGWPEYVARPNDLAQHVVG